MPDQLIGIARDLYQKGKYKQAIERYQLFIKTFPGLLFENAWVRYEIGLCFFVRKDYGEARKYFIEVIENYPIFKKPHALSLYLIRKIDSGRERRKSGYLN